MVTENEVEILRWYRFRLEWHQKKGVFGRPAVGRSILVALVALLSVLCEIVDGFHCFFQVRN